MKKMFKVGFAGLFLLVAAACGSSTETTETTTEAVAEASFPVTVGDLTLEAQPERIVSLSPTATEMLYAIGAGAQVVAVDEYSNYPQEAVDLGTPLSGFEPNIEAISGYEPDLVVISYDPGSLVEQLGSLGIPVFTANAAMNLDGVYEQITQFGALTGQSTGAASLIDQMKADSKDPVVQRILGTSEDTGKLLGLDKDWAYRAIKAVGNYGEIFERNVGPKSALGLPRGVNNLWNKGGLMYAPPIR